MPDTLQVTLVDANPRTAVLRVQGQLNARSTPVLLERCRAVRSTGKCLVLNLSQVSFIASSGVGGLLSLPEEFHEVGLALRFACLSPAVESVIKLLNLQAYLDIAATEEAALSALAA